MDSTEVGTQAELAEAIALNVRRLRQQRQMTLDGLAERAGISKGTVIQVEQGRANPSIATLCRIADALGVGVATVVELDQEPRVTVRRRDQAVALWDDGAGSRAVFLVGTDPPEIVELWDWVLQPGQEFHGDAHPRGTVEVLDVLERRLALAVGERREVLAVGDTVLFEAHKPHVYANPGDGPNRFVMSILQPTEPLPPPTSITSAEGG